MAEITYSSAGVYTNEIDLSQPRAVTPTGTPAGVIGTADRGPAFVPITVGNYQSFVAAFGSADGSKFGPLAVNQFLKNAQALTYVRALGIGDGKQRSSTTGQVTWSGFVVGNQQVKDNGLIGTNPYGTVGGGPLGRTHFLGCFMSESAGSTIFSEAGITLNISGAVPIIRGVLMAPSGVIPTLSGNFVAKGSESPSSTTTAMLTVANAKGGLTGSVDLATQQFVLLLNGHKSTGEFPNVLTCSFETTSGQYFSHVLNTDPLKIQEAGHLLYSHYNIDTSLAVVTGSGILSASLNFTAGKDGGTVSTFEPVAFITTSSISRDSSDTYVPNYENFRERFKTPATPYFTSQVYGASAYNLFRVHSVDDGAYANTLFKITISNLKPASTDDGYGTFSLTVRDFNDNDYEKTPLETYNGLSLDPGSDRYIGRMIGDQRAYFDFDQASSAQKLVLAGDFPVRSNYVRVELGDQLKNGNVPNTALPVGFRGLSHLVTSGTNPLTSPTTGYYYTDGGEKINYLQPGLTTDILKRAVQPPVTFRRNVAVGEGINKKSRAGLGWGVQFETITSLATPNALKRNDPTIVSLAKFFPGFHPTSFNFSVGNNEGTADSQGTVLDCDTFNNNIFSLERVKVRTGSVMYGGVTVADIDHWASASYVRKGSITADETAKTRAFKVDDLKAQGNRAYLSFTTIAQGGFNGLDILNKDKSRLLNASAKREMDDVTNQGGTSGPTVSAYRKAVDIMGTKSEVEINLLAIPGLRHTSVTNYAMDSVESRFDSMYIMDIEERDELDSVVTSSVGANVNVTNTVNAFLGRALNTSFAAAYFPDVVIQEPTNLTNVRVPPSTVVLGAFAQNDAIGYPWFAPAGFSRGSLSSVQQTSLMFNKQNLDDIYDADINPITEPVPGAGIMVWGQKTLLSNASALDRVNVRRLLIYIRRRVRDVSRQMLFEPNRQETLDKFTSLVQPILQTIQERSGVDRYKVIIDATTTTQTDVENNTLRGKIFIQPTRTAEFVALDFVVTNAGDGFANA